MHTADKIRKIIQVRGRMLQENGMEPTREELAAACEMPLDKLQQLLQLHPEVCSLDAPLGPLFYIYRYRAGSISQANYTLQMPTARTLIETIRKRLLADRAGTTAGRPAVTIHHRSLLP